MIYNDYLKSNSWKELRLIAYRRANHKCEFCGEKASAVHHVKYPKNYSEDLLENLVVVCKKHHKLVHGIRDHCTLRDLLIFSLKNGVLIDKDVLVRFFDVEMDLPTMKRIIKRVIEKIKPNKIVTMQSIKLLKESHK